MYEFFVGLHNLLRWVVVVAGVGALVLSLIGTFARSTWSRAVQTWGLVFTAALGLQVVLGLGIYVVSPYLQTLLNDPGAAMGVDSVRFFAVEHISLMILAFVAGQLGYSLSKRAEGDRRKYVRASIGYVLSAALIAFGIPWWASLVPWA